MTQPQWPEDTEVSASPTTHTVPNWERAQTRGQQIACAALNAIIPVGWGILGLIANTQPNDNESSG